MPCEAAADDDRCRVNDCSTTSPDHTATRRHSDRRLTLPALPPPVASASKTTSSSWPATSRRRLAMWRSLSSLWRRPSSGVVTTTPTAERRPADDASSDTQQCSFVRTRLFRLQSERTCVSVDTLIARKQPCLRFNLSERSAQER